MGTRIYYIQSLCLATIGMGATTSYAQKVSTQDLMNQRVNTDFTLVFDVVREDVSTFKARSLEYRQTVKDYAARVKAGQLTQVEANKTLSVLKNEYSVRQPSEHFSLTLSSKDGVLMVQEMRPTKRTVWLGHDGKTLQFDGAADSIDYAGNLFERNGAISCNSTDVPLLGFSIPEFPLFKKNDFPPGFRVGESPFQCSALLEGARGATPGLCYSPSRTTAENVDGIPRVSQIDLLVAPNAVFQSWELKESSKFCGVWLPKVVVLTQNAFVTEKGAGPAPAIWRATYRLKKASPTPLPVTRFQIDSYLQKRTAVRMLDAQFDYDPALGNLAQQYQLARNSNGSGAVPAASNK